MKADVTKMAAMQGRIDAMEARDKARDAADKRTKDVAEAMARLAGLPLGADLEGKLVAFHTKAGGNAELFGAYVDSMEQNTAPLPGGDGKAAAFVSQLGKVSEACMAYQKDGTDAVDKAANFSRQWKELHDTGHTRMAEEDFIANNMARAAARN